MLNDRTDGSDLGVRRVTDFRARMIVVLLSACALSVGFALASEAGLFHEEDADSDGIVDDGDNCLGLVNPNQRDDDEDGYGNLCDADINQDCITGAVDLATVFAAFGTSAPWTPKNLGARDVNEDNNVGAADLASVFAKFGNPPGPSGKSCADCTATPTLGLGLGVCP